MRGLTKLVDSLIEVRLVKNENFLMIAETLRRIGIPVVKDGQRYLYQSCHILSKKEKTRFFIVHFKELYALDGKSTTFSEHDKARRNTISNKLSEWGLIELIDPQKSALPTVPFGEIKILSADEKKDWKLCPMYRIGKKYGTKTEKDQCIQDKPDRETPDLRH